MRKSIFVFSLILDLYVYGGKSFEDYLWFIQFSNKIIKSTNELYKPENLNFSS